MISQEAIERIRKEYPQYDVNGKKFGTDYQQASMYYRIHGGVLGEKLDPMTPWHVLVSDHSMS